MTAPDILDEIKQDLDVTGSTDDAWFQRRIDAIWRRMEVYTERALCVPPKAFIDDWGLIAQTGVIAMPPLIAAVPRASVFLRYFPVVSVDAVYLNDTSVTPANVSFDRNNGKLLSVQNAIYAEDMSRALLTSKARITYKAGWADVPADLYEIVLGALQPLWAAKKGGGVPGVSGNVTGINVMDVGSVELSDANLFVASAAKSGKAGDPLLGPYASMLDHYIDYRSRIGWAGQPTTIPAPP